MPETADFPEARFFEFGWGDAAYYPAREATLGMALSAALVPTPAVVHVVGLDRHPADAFPEAEVARLVIDAYINTDPGLHEKRDIVVNAVELARALGVETPNVALVAATHVIENQLRSTVEAAALCKMADRGQIENANLEGPLPYDMAVSNNIARRKGVISAVCGAADIVVCPHLEAGHLLVKQLASQARAQTAHVILGGRVPILLPSKVDETLPRLASFALAAMMAAPPSGDSS